MRNRMLASKWFLFPTIAFLILLSPFAGKAQNNSAVDCKQAWRWVWVWENEDEYNPITGKHELKYVRRYRYRYRFGCDPIPSKNNSTISRDKTPNNSNVPSSYAGKYIGGWVARFTVSGVEEHVGTWEIFIDAGGKVTGVEFDKTSESKGDVSGFIDEDGHIKVFITYTNTVTIEGMLEQRGIRLAGVLKQTCSNGHNCANIEINLESSSTSSKQSQSPPKGYEYNREGNRLFEQKKYKEAIENYTMAISLVSDDVSSYKSRGNAKLELKDYRGAIADYDEAIRIYSKWEDEVKADYSANKDKAVSLTWAYEAYHSRGVAKKILGDKVGAARDFGKACRLGFDEDCKP